MPRFLQFIFLFILFLTSCNSRPNLDGIETPVVETQSATTVTPVSPTPKPTKSPGVSDRIYTPTPSQIPSATTTLVPTSIPVTTLLFTGIIVPARCVQAKIDELGDPNYPYEEVREIIRGADLAVGTLNATISDFPPRTGCVRTFVLVGGADNADALADAGLDVMSVATNHIKNCGVASCGDRAFYETLEHLERVGILPVGAGVNHAEAIQPWLLR